MNAKGQHFMHTIRNSSNHLLNIINDILDMAALREGKLTVAAPAGEQRYFNMPTPMAGGEDMASIIDEMGGAFVFLGAHKPGVDYMTAAVNHSNKAEFDDSVIPDGCALLAALAFDHLGSPAN